MQADESISVIPASSGNKVRVGTRIIKQLSTTFYPNPLIIFDELVANSRDALATTVKLDVQDIQITIEDDGEGMDRDGLVKFFYISHTGKVDVPVRSFKGVKRYIIGKFGIGKLSLYQICKSFDIETWRAGKLSRASFDFEEFEREEFIDTFELSVITELTERKGSGTKITLRNLKEKIDAIKIKRHLMQTMPLTKDFQIILSGMGLGHPITLASKDVIHGNVHLIRGNIPDLGDINGTVIFKHSEKGGEFGVFIRVFERLVNLDSPHTIVNFANLNHARQFNRKIYADINVNGLNDALQTNRAGFIVTHPKYISFMNWLKKELNRLSDLEYEKYEKARDTVEKKVIPSAISEALAVAATKTSLSIRTEQRPIKENNLPSPRHEEQTRKKESTEVSTPGLFKLLSAGDLKIEISELGILEPEATYDKKRKALAINSSSPAYRFARSQGKLAGVVYHIFKACAVLIALESAKTLQEFKEIYDGLIRNPEVLDKLKKRWGRLGYEHNNE
ncbi:MAG: ATP-binding protein [Candidatus Micrarchaeota archaeon]